HRLRRDKAASRKLLRFLFLRFSTLPANSGGRRALLHAEARPALRERLIGCIECNRWGRQGDATLALRLLEDDQSEAASVGGMRPEQTYPQRTGPRVRTFRS